MIIVEEKHPQGIPYSSLKVGDVFCFAVVDNDLKQNYYYLKTIGRGYVGFDGVYQEGIALAPSRSVVVVDAVLTIKRPR